MGIVNEMSTMMKKDHMWELLNTVPVRFLNTNMNGIPQNVVDDDRIPQRFVPQRPRKLPDLSKDPRVPLRFLKEKSSSEYKYKENVLNKDIDDDIEKEEAVEEKISQPWRRTNPRSINLSIKQLMTQLVEKVDDENKENEDKNNENISIFDPR